MNAQADQKAATVDVPGDDTCFMNLNGVRVNASVNDFLQGTTDMKIAVLGSDDC